MHYNPIHNASIMFSLSDHCRLAKAKSIFSTLYCPPWERHDAWNSNHAQGSCCGEEGIGRQAAVEGIDGEEQSHVGLTKHKHGKNRDNVVANKAQPVLDNDEKTTTKSIRSAVPKSIIL
jgi:hypothetical protein